MGGVLTGLFSAFCCASVHLLTLGCALERDWRAESRPNREKALLSSSRLPLRDRGFSEELVWNGNINANS